ncbi:hypothetical protein GCM10027517_23100 [Phycicoccus ginsengisoli]
MEPRAIDRLSQTLVQVEPPLEQVRTPEHLRAWADAVIERATGVLAAQPRGDRDAAVAARPGQAAAGGDGVFGLREWELALSRALSRLQAGGGLSCGADTTTLGSAFAALLYGGLLLGQASGDACPLRAAMDMALSQIEGVTRS